MCNFQWRQNLTRPYKSISSQKMSPHIIRTSDSHKFPKSPPVFFSVMVNSSVLSLVYILVYMNYGETQYMNEKSTEFLQCFRAPELGLEPRTLWLTVRCSNQLSYSGILFQSCCFLDCGCKGRQKNRISKLFCKKVWFFLHIFVEMSQD